MMTVKTIPSRYFDELRDSGHTVPRELAHGNVIPFKVGKNYKIKNSKTGEVVTARCTQDCPHHLKLIEVKMKLVATKNGYKYYVGTDEKEKQFYNVVPSKQSHPNSGYYDADYICDIKKVPNLFK